MKLFFREFGQKNQPKLYIFHGLCGSSRNWHSVSEALEQKGYSLTLLDSRDHGQSPWSDSLNYRVLSEDFLEHLRIHPDPTPYGIIGHSMGGKLAMSLATHSLSDNPPLGLCIVDIAPKTYHPHYQDALRACLNLDLKTITSRKDADEKLTLPIPNPAFRQFLLSNLYSENGSWRWSCNFSLILKDLPNLAANPLSETDRCHLPSLFIAGSSSDFITPADTPLIEKHFPSASIKALPAGHNVHIEAREAFIEAIDAFFKPLFGRL